MSRGRSAAADPQPASSGGRSIDRRSAAAPAGGSWGCGSARHSFRHLLHSPDGERDRFDDRLVPGAAAKYAADGVADLLARRVGVGLHQFDSRHQHCGRAVAALETVLFPERVLNGMKRIDASQTLDSADLAAVRLHCKGEAGARRAAIEQDGAHPADPVFATDMSACETQLMAQKVAEKESRLYAAFVDDAIDADAYPLVIDGHVGCSRPVVLQRLSGGSRMVFAGPSAARSSAQCPSRQSADEIATIGGIGVDIFRGVDGFRRLGCDRLEHGLVWTRTVEHGFGRGNPDRTLGDTGVAKVRMGAPAAIHIECRGHRDQGEVALALAHLLKAPAAPS